MKQRCAWAGTDPLMISYHDTEWGVPVHDERTWFEFLLLEGFQAGLSWSTILKKRAHFKKAFKNFDYRKIATFTKKDTAALMRNEGIIRNRLKIDSAVTNAQAFLDVQREFGSFDSYIWKFTHGKPIKHKITSASMLPATTPLSDALSKDLKKRGFRFVGSTIVYAHMQATGMVNDHEISCFRYNELY